MNARILCSVAALALASACGGGGGGSTGGGSQLPVTVSVTSLPANGTATTLVTVTGSIAFPLVINTAKGTFEVGGQSTGSSSIRFDVGPVQVNLRACDFRGDASCFGTVLVSVVDSAGSSGRVQVTFTKVERCDNGVDDDGNGKIDCLDTASCGPGVACGLNGKTCGAAGTGNAGQCACAAGAELCGGGRDAYCGKAVVCADPLCQPQGGGAGAQCDTGQVVGGHHVLGACTSGGVCTCSGSGTETACGDGLDNNCNGLIDCDDPACQPSGNAPGQACSSARPGLTCSTPAATGGVSTCTVCAPGGSFTNAQPVETKCTDGIDNDCSGASDCSDPNCADLALVCGANGERCTSGFQCRCPDLSGVESSCSDGLDNDCDSKIDCADSDCNGRSCGPNGLTCATGTCKCPGGQTKETTCNDGQDNDCDGQVDCADPDCRPVTAGGSDGQACSTAASGKVGQKCDFLGQCSCPGGQMTETTCDDHLDNDCDGLIDCADPDCLGRSCGTNGVTCGATVASGGCTCPGGATEICTDGVDNNCNGTVDCADPQCQGTPGHFCGTGPTATYRCALLTAGSTTWVCRDTSAYVVTLTPGVLRLAANGLATTTVTAFLQDTTKTPPAVTGATIDFGTTLGTFQGAGTTIQGVTGADGKATVTLVASTAWGTATVSGMYTYNAGANSVTGSTSVVLPQLSQITLFSQQYAIMGALGSGYQESNELTFQLTDSTNQAYPPGLGVTFTHTSVGGSYIGADPAACDLVTKLCTVTGQTDASGRVKVILHSGTQATVTSVSLSATGGGATVVFNSGNIAIVGAKASGNEISVSCTPRNIPALTDTDCSKSNYGGGDATITCTVSLADRFKNKLGVATLVEMRTEAGAAGLPTSTPAYTIVNPPANLGKAINTITATGYGLPADVTPLLGVEYSLDHAWDGCGTKTHNPRDGLVTIIAAVSGEEGFVDGSNNCPADGIYNPSGSYPGFPSCAGEYFIDLGEPFVDYNDNGLHDANEPFIDGNGNGAYDVANGMWDAKTIIWSETRIVYTGYTAAGQVGGNNAASRFYDPPQYPLPTTPTPQPYFSVLAAHPGPPATLATSDSVPVSFTDVNFNLPTSRTTYSTSVQAGAKITAAFSADTPSAIDDLGMDFKTQFCDRKVPTNPTTQCFASCLFPVCYAVTSVGNFDYGTGGLVIINGGSTPDAGMVCAYATSSLTTNSVTVQLSVPVCGFDP